MEHEHEYERAKLFFERKIMVHVIKEDGAFYNGLITELSEKFFTIKDRYDGDQFIFFRELAKPIKAYIKEDRK